jgi:hypothetical protein
MKTRKLVLLTYGFLLGYIFCLVLTTNLTVRFIFPAVSIMLFTLIIFWLSSKPKASQRKSLQDFDSFPQAYSPHKCLILGLVCLVSSVIYVYSALGLSASQVLDAWLSGTSLYNRYQLRLPSIQFEKESIIYLPRLFLLFLVKGIWLIATLQIMTRTSPAKARERVLIVVLCVSLIYIGLARGTGLELFQVLTLFQFAVVVKNRTTKISPKTIFIIVGLAFLGLFLYVNILKSRDFIPLSISFQNESFLWSNSPITSVSNWSLLLLPFYSYFGFGFIYNSVFILEVWITSFSNFLTGLLPFGFIFQNIDPKELVSESINVGVRWIPDSARVISLLGFLGLIFVVWLLGRACASLENDSSTASFVVRYCIFLQMFSFPIGGLFWIDRPLLIVVILILTGRLFKLMRLRLR